MYYIHPLFEQTRDFLVPQNGWMKTSLEDRLSGSPVSAVDEDFDYGNASAATSPKDALPRYPHPSFWSKIHTLTKIM